MAISSDLSNLRRRLVFFADVVFSETFKNEVYFGKRSPVEAGGVPQRTGALKRSPTLETPWASKG